MSRPRAGQTFSLVAGIIMHSDECRDEKLLFEILGQIDKRPEPFEFYTARELWTDEHISKQMLSFHLDPDIDAASRRTAFIDRSAAWITERFQLGPGVKVADFGCGPGLYTTRLATSQAGITGIDFSDNSLRYARKSTAESGLTVDYVNASYLDYDTEERFDLILMIMCDFCALSPAQRERMLTRFSRFLRPGGAVLLDAYSLKAFEERKETSTFEKNLMNGFWAQNDYFGFLKVFKYETEKVVLDKYTLVEPKRIRTVYNWLQYFSPDSIGREFTLNGFRIESYYSDVAGGHFDPDGGEFAVVARKA